MNLSPRDILSWCENALASVVWVFVFVVIGVAFFMALFGGAQ